MTCLSMKRVLTMLAVCTVAFSTSGCYVTLASRLHNRSSSSLGVDHAHKGKTLHEDVPTGGVSRRIYGPFQMKMGTLPEKKVWVPLDKLADDAGYKFANEKHKVLTGAVEVIFDFNVDDQGRLWLKDRTGNWVTFN